MKIRCKKDFLTNNIDYFFKAGEQYEAEDITATTKFHEKKDDHIYKKFCIQYKNGGSCTFYKTEITTEEFRYRVLCTGLGYFNDHFIDHRDRKEKIKKIEKNNERTS